jgi:hypothetical protein
MARQFRCGTRMDGSGAGTAPSSPNRDQGAATAMPWNTPPAPDGTAWEPGALEAGRGALPAGHPLSWGLITAGTVLDGAPYTLFP